MLQQQLRQKDEDLAAKSAEIGDLKERVAELEKLQQQQQQLLSLKDSELAAAQQRLADARKAADAAPAARATPAAATPTPQASTAQAVQPAQDATPQSPATSMPWLWGGLAFLGMALLAWLFVRRRPKAAPKPAPRRSFDSEALAASMVAPTIDDDPAPAASATSAPEPVRTVIDLDEVRATPAPRVETPNWHSGWVKTAPPAAAPEAPTPRFVPPPEAEAPRVVPEAVPEPAAAPKVSAEQRMKLARAFLDIGDDHSARQLLRELLDGPDPAARTEAARMLRELG
jgi:pilus assembly protein FimV